jgi:diguanylate cyclase (GGDEF)-like protein
MQVTKDKSAQIQSEIQKLLVHETCTGNEFIGKVDQLAKRFGDDFYPALIFTAAHLEFKKRTAKKHWLEILNHWNCMSHDLKREIDFRVALLDYFVHINRRLKNPKIIEINMFQKTQKETYIDELTNLNNYRYFKRALDEEIRRANRYNEPLTLVMMDVDDFKVYNDQNGHITGNTALKKFARILKKSVRNVDNVARYGGEEFVLICPETTKEGGFVIADRIRERVERSTFVAEKKQPLRTFTISGGVATLNVDASTASNLINRADQALYRAKARGKNQIALYIDERRDTERVAASITGQLMTVSHAGDVFTVQNISKSSLLIRFNKAIPLGTILQLSLRVSDRKTPIRCETKVRRVAELKKNKDYEIGVRIIRASERDRKALHRYVYSLLEKNIKEKQV